MKKGYFYAAISGAAAGTLFYLLKKQFTESKKADCKTNIYETNAEEKETDDVRSSTDLTCENDMPSIKNLRDFVDRLLEETSGYDEPIESDETDPEIFSDDSRIAQRLLLYACFSMVKFMFPENEHKFSVIADMLNSAFYPDNDTECKTAFNYMFESAAMWLRGEISEKPPIISSDDFSAQMTEDWCAELRGVELLPEDRSYLTFIIKSYESCMKLLTDENANDVIRNSLYRVRRYALENMNICL